MREDLMIDTPARPSVVPADWPTFHLAHPSAAGEEPYDTNGIFFWAGRYHLHYVYPNKEDGLAWAHVSSPDLVHWTWHPTVLTQSITGNQIFSGAGFVTKEGRPAAVYGSSDPDAGVLTAHV